MALDSDLRRQVEKGRQRSYRSSRPAAGDQPRRHRNRHRHQRPSAIRPVGLLTRQTRAAGTAHLPASVARPCSLRAISSVAPDRHMHPALRRPHAGPSSSPRLRSQGRLRVPEVADHVGFEAIGKELAVAMAAETGLLTTDQLGTIPRPESLTGHSPQPPMAVSLGRDPSLTNVSRTMPAAALRQATPTPAPSGPERRQLNQGGAVADSRRKRTERQQRSPSTAVSVKAWPSGRAYTAAPPHTPPRPPLPARSRRTRTRPTPKDRRIARVGGLGCAPRLTAKGEIYLNEFHRVWSTVPLPQSDDLENIRGDTTTVSDRPTFDGEGGTT